MKPTTDISYREVAIIMELLDTAIHTTQEMQDHVWKRNGDYYSHFKIIENDVLKKRDFVSAFSTAKKNLVDRGLIKEFLQKNKKKQGRGTDTVKCYQLNPDKFIDVYDMLVPNCKDDPVLYKWILGKFLESDFFNKEIIGIFKEYETGLTIDQCVITTDDVGRVIPALEEDPQPWIPLDKRLMPLIRISPSVLHYFLKNLDEIYQMNKESMEKKKKGESILTFNMHTLYLTTIMKLFNDDVWGGDILNKSDDILRIPHPTDQHDVTYTIFTDLKDLGIRDDFHVETITTRVIWVDKRYKKKLNEVDKILGNRHFKERISEIIFFNTKDPSIHGIIPIDEMFRDWYQERLRTKTLPEGFSLQLAYTNPKYPIFVRDDWESFLKEKPLEKENEPSENHLEMK